MFANTPIGPILLFLAIAVVVAVLAQKAAAARRRALQDLADQLGWRFDPDRDSGHDERYPHFDVFQRGHSRSARNTMAGRLDCDGQRLNALAGDFRYVTGSGKNKHTHYFSYLIVHLPFSTPALQLRPEGLFDKLAAAIGFDDIDFESVEFSRKFFVKSKDKRFAYALLDPRMMEFLLRERPPGIEIECGQICIADGSRRWDVARFRAVMKFAQDFLSQWPSHLRKELESMHG